MGDDLSAFERYKSIKEIADLIDDIKKLREYYSSKQYDEMQKHIACLTIKYLFDTITWNAVNSDMPTNYEQAYNNAEQFLRSKGINILIKNGIKTSM